MPEISLICSFARTCHEKRTGNYKTGLKTLGQDKTRSASNMIWLLSQNGYGQDASGSYAVFTEERSSTSQMTAAKAMDIISRLPGCDGQAADAVSAFTHVKMEDAPKLLKIPKSECPDIWIRLPRDKWPKSWSSISEKSSSGRTIMGKAI